ncbi:MAG: DUF5837 family cyanobactin class RiPP [Pseudomonadota bacterium]|uniref:DUF5837 family cyanobactin class RiPP n=1 Tax=Sphingomonas sp. ERG5 TaxID=1381597 RepID=UPI00054B15D2|nr:DUF5837 family cyanobactin class RiPP [Sphingomonas sp. ERG5]
MNTQIRPIQTAPVARNVVGNDLLAELSEETLVGVTPSVSVTLPCGISATVTCAYSGSPE